MGSNLIAVKSIEKSRRIKEALKETTNLLTKEEKQYADSLVILKMEIKENKNFGNGPGANRLKVNRSNAHRLRITELKMHMNKLKNLL